MVWKFQNANIWTVFFKILFTVSKPCASPHKRSPWNSPCNNLSQISMFIWKEGSEHSPNILVPQEIWNLNLDQINLVKVSDPN